MARRVFSSTGVGSPSFLTPYPLAKTTLPSFTIDTESPGTSKVFKTRATYASKSAGGAFCANTGETQTINNSHINSQGRRLSFMRFSLLAGNLRWRLKHRFRLVRTCIGRQLRGALRAKSEGSP